MLKPPLVYILIVNYNNWTDSVDCIQHILKSNYTNYKIILVDNASTNESILKIEKWIETQYANTDTNKLSYKRLLENDIGNLKKIVQEKFITLLEAKKNHGFAGANNLFIRNVINDDAFLWMVNPDVIVNPSTLHNLVNHEMKMVDPSITGVEMRSYCNPQKTLFIGGHKIIKWKSSVKSIMSFNDINKMDYVNGGCLFVHIKYFKKIGLFKEDYFLYWEEADWCTRAKEQGLQMTVPINTTCLDKGSTTIGRGKLAYYYYTRNSFYYLDHFNFKRQKYVALIFTIVKILFAFVKGNFNKSIGILLGLTDYIKMKRGINIHV